MQDSNRKSDAFLKQPLLKQKKNRLRLETSEDDRLYKKNRLKNNIEFKQSVRNNLPQVRAYCIADEINLKMHYAPPDGSFNFKTEEECHIFYNNKDFKYLFIFDFGVTIFWNFTQQEQWTINNRLSHLLVNGLKPDDIEDDIMLVKQGIVENPRIEDNIIYLTTEEVNEKFAHSYAFAQSVKLDIFENSVDKTIKATETIPRNLAKKGRIEVNQTSIYKMIGSIFMLRSSVNLISGMLDCPDCFWNEATWEEIYNKSRDYYDLEERIEIINNRLDLIKELYDMLNDDLHNKHTANLEWIVIWLIFMEIVIEVVWNIILKDVLKIV